MNRRYVIAALAGLGLGVACFVAGRYTAPTKTVTEVKTETNIVYRYRENTQTQKRVVTVKEPSGKVTRTEDINTGTQVAAGTDAQVVTASKQTTTLDRPSWKVSGGVKINGDLLLGKPTYVLQLDRRLIGPVWLGVQGTTDRQFTLTLGAEF
jgi:hypothetical protein